MGDLISRSTLLELFKSLRDEHETSCISYNALYELILQQKTAYDVEAVVAELEKYMKASEKDYVLFQLTSALGEMRAFEKAISIVRGKE